MKLKLLSKDSGDFLILASSSEDVHIGDYLLVSEKERAALLQVYDERYLDLEGIEEELLREELVQEEINGSSYGSASLRSVITRIHDMRVLVCKPRSFFSSGERGVFSYWLPSRSSSRITKVDFETISQNIKSGTRKIYIGKVAGKDFSIFAESLDGKITLITGKKESGKSHLAKILLKGLTLHGAYSFVFDLNEEYSFFCSDPEVSHKTLKLLPGRNLRFSLSSAGLRAVSSILAHSLEMPGTSLREFTKIWDYLERSGRLTLSNFLETVERWRCNEFVRDALFSRINTLMSTGLFTDIEKESYDLNEPFKRAGGCTAILSLTQTSPLTRKVIVELILSKLTEMLEKKEIPPVFLFAEEAHLYLRETYWEDLITRMRHFGVFTIFITNQPDSIDKKIYRQIDNIFVYHLSNDSDINLISQSSAVDFESLTSIIKALQPRTCLVLGSVVSNLPVVVEVGELVAKETGITRLFFRQIDSLKT